MTPPSRIASLTLLVAGCVWAQPPSLSVLGTYRTGRFNVGAAEIVAHDSASQRLFVVNGGDWTVDILDMSVPANLSRVTQTRPDLRLHRQRAAKQHRGL